MMAGPFVKSKSTGNKKIVVSRKNVIDNIYEQELSKAFTDGSVTDSNTYCRILTNMLKSGATLHVRDSVTGETYFHVLCKTVHHYTEAKTVKIFYQLGTQIDLNAQDHLGDTVLHKICLSPGAWRCIVAVMRCGASTLIKNNLGQTAEEQLLEYKRQGWEENLYWLQKFSPGLFDITSADQCQQIKHTVVDKLLKSWCRTSKVVGDSVITLKQLFSNNNLSGMICVVILEKYENNNEFALGMLSGSTEMIDACTESVALGKVDVNTRDHSYQYNYLDYPTAPRPLLAAIWETENLELVQKFMSYKPDTSVKYTFEAEATSPPKPLFFMLVNPKSRPQDPNIIATILKGSDLSIRNEKGETILFEAIFNNESETVIRTILDCGVSIAARDLNGRTARDHCVLLQRDDYRGLIDSHVIKMAADLNTAGLESLVLQQYDQIPHELMKLQVSHLPANDDTKQMLYLLKNICNIQVTIKKLFSHAKFGNFTQFSKLMTPKLVNARDKAGRSLLHYAIQNSAFVSTNQVIGQNIMDDISTMCIDRENQEFEPTQDTEKLQITKENKPFRVTEIFSSKCAKADFFGIISSLVGEFPHMTSFMNNLGQTALHCAYIYSAGKEVIDVLNNAGNQSHAEDIFGFLPKDYNLHLCGEQTFESRRKPTLDMDLNIFLTESKFEAKLRKSIQTGRTCKLRCLIDPLIEFGGEPQFNHVLFDCLDAKRISLASYLIQKGFNTNISKQYDMCNPTNPMCAMLECSHTVTTLRQRAMEVGASDLVNLINKRVLGKKT